MTDMDIKKLLQEAGLDRHEMTLYLSLVQLKESTAGQLSKMSGIPRTYAYKILESLENKGFVRTANSNSIRRYAITDYEAPKRYIERQQFNFYRINQEAQALSAQLESLASPQAPQAIAEPLKDSFGMDDFWKLLHSTITREIWVINPPQWWGDAGHSNEIKKWEQFRTKQHIWEKRFTDQRPKTQDSKFNEYQKIAFQTDSSALFLIDQYQIQVTCWSPFRALRIESAEMVETMKQMLQ
jgi:sugar-specific transcriptional regulator TrmB